MLLKYKMGGCQVNIQVRLNQKTFLRFSRFDVLRHRKLWRSPALFAAILGASAAVCFLMHETSGAVVLGTVLLAAGLGVPAAYFLSYYLSLRKQIQKEGLAQPKYVYTLSLQDPGGISVDNGREHAVYSWEQVFHAYRDADATYLYITPQRAFLLPHDCVPGGADGLWELIGRKLPDGRRTVL